MARSYVEVIQDDLTGETVVDGQSETIQFAVNGKNYSIDLAAANAAEFHELLGKYIAVATKVPAKALRGAVRADREQLAAIRNCAASKRLFSASRPGAESALR